MLLICYLKFRKDVLSFVFAEWLINIYLLSKCRSLYKELMRPLKVRKRVKRRNRMTTKQKKTKKMRKERKLRFSWKRRRKKVQTTFCVKIIFDWIIPWMRWVVLNDNSAGVELELRFRVTDSSGESDSSDDSDIEGEATSALFMVISLWLEELL